MQKVEKLKQRKNKEDKFKICKNCRLEFKEEVNFNWSCRIHQSKWSGEMWWCCGKSSKLALGCKFSKHEVEHEEEEQLKTQHYELNDRCLCCKDLGHKIENCPKDPNLKTKHS